MAPYRRRTQIRRHLPYALLWLAPKGRNVNKCVHEWYYVGLWLNADEHGSTRRILNCYHCIAETSEAEQ